MKPEHTTEHQHEIREASFRRLTGELRRHPTIKCDAGSLVTGEFVTCGESAICRVGCGEGHPSCERHAQGESYVFPLDE